MSNQKKTGLVLNVILLFASLTLLFLALEAAFRLLSFFEDRKIFSEALKQPVDAPENGEASLGHLIVPNSNNDIVYDLKANLTVDFLGISVRTNSDGFRDSEYPIPKPKDTIRIIGIGDSVMFGWKIPQEKNYLSLLEEKLNHSFPGKKWEVINTAVPGYNTVNEVSLLGEKGLKYKPDIVILGYAWNDMELPFFIRKKGNYFSFRKSFAVSFILERIASKKKNPLEHHENLDSVPDEYRHMIGENAVFNALEELKILGEKNGFETIIIFYCVPDPKPIMEKAAQLGFHVFDLDPLFTKHVANAKDRIKAFRTLFLNLDDKHPSVLSNQMASDFILELMIKNGFHQKYGLPPEY
jgi:hypothetical protein